METSEQKITIWQRHPKLTILGAMLANLLIVIPYSVGFVQIADHTQSDSLSNALGWALFFIVFSVFFVAVYSIRLKADSRVKHICVIFGTSLILFVVWFIFMLILALLGMGMLARSH